MLVLSRKQGEVIVIRDDIRITVVECIGKIRLGIDAPDDVSIHREEVYKKIHRSDENVDGY